MLVQFRFRNFGPFKDEAVLDMRAIKAYKEHPYNLHKEENGDDLLKVVAIYGANASGKTKCIAAYSAFLQLIRRSFSMNDKGEKQSVLARHYIPFMLDHSSREENGEFEGVYHDDGQEYRYGFVFDEKSIKYEWLYKKSLTTRRQVRILERGPEGFELGASVRESCGKYLSDIDGDVLALSFFSSLKLKNPVFKKVVQCVAGVVPVFISSNEEINDVLRVYFEDFSDAEKRDLLAFLHAIDVGIKDIEVEKSESNLMVYTYHIGKDNKRHMLTLGLESDGTRRAIAFYSAVQIALQQGNCLMIDEFNNQLHPLLQKYIVDLFYAENTQGQLIYTTHDTSLLDKQFMRRDQIWFANKNEVGESSLYSLAEFKIRNDKSFEKDYLGGVYGGIPNLKDFSFTEG